MPDNRGSPYWPCSYRKLRSKYPEFSVWEGIKRRCLDPRRSKYRIYGGRGITMAQEWVESFFAFYKAVGPRPTPKHQIDRIDNDKGYEPGNVRWATNKENNNNRGNLRLVTIEGVTRNISQWCEVLGINRRVVFGRIHQFGWSPLRALVQPVGKPGRPRGRRKNKVAADTSC
jgi:hypothetical protein